MNVLIVDDREDNRYLLKTLLVGHGHTVAVVNNGTEALAAARGAHFDLVVSDVLMPSMDGFQLCREMKADAALAAIPFVYYSATYTDARDIEFGLSLGAVRYLVKPCEPDVLLHELEHAAMAAGAPALPPADDDPVYLKQYNSRLIAKLEKKMLDLEAANRALQQDIAIRERLERQLREAQKLEAVGRLAGGIAHDFNNILAGIVGYAELAMIEPEVSAAVRENLHGILNSAQRARDLVQQILSFSRRRERNRSAMRPGAVLGEALKMLRASLPAHIELHAKVEDNTPVIIADATEIHQVVTNLVTNAWHAIGDRDGSIEVRVGSLHVDEERAASHPGLHVGEYARLSVADNGCGMDERTRQHIFEPFFTTKEAGKGNGIGLAVVHGIVHASGGIVTVESTLGSGTTVTVFFPAHDGEPASVAAERSGTQPGRGQRILFVDDDPTLTALAAQFFSRLGYVIETETNPLAALTRFRGSRYDIVVTDLTMPYASGIEVARECHRARPGVPVILITGFNPMLSPDELRDHGITAIVNKPYTIQALGDTVAAALATGMPSP